MALHQAVDPETLAFYMRLALGKHPKDAPHIAFKKWIIENKVPKVFFQSAAGERCILGADIEYFNPWRRRTNYRKHQVDDRIFYVRKYKETLTQIDRPKPAGALIAHPSESGWRLPRTHKRHFLNFPAEIQHQILEEVLTAPHPESVQPSVISSNWGTKWNTPHFALGTWSDFGHLDKYNASIQLAWTPCKDQHGHYFEVRKVFRTPLDATILRTNRHFYRTGIDILYGRNSFTFNMVVTAWRASPPTLLPGDLLLRPNPGIPNRDHWAIKMNEAVQFIESSVDSHQLPGYIYYDHFLRFLHFIGPKNATRLRTLEFRGFVKRHPCRDKFCAQKGEEFIHSMRFYTLFINKFCRGVEKIILHADEDTFYCYGGPVAVDDIAPPTHKEAMLPFLENELRTIQTLKVLEIVDINKVPDTSYAEPTIAWLKERHARQIREDREAEAKRKFADLV
ncbi:hypothetical protein V8E51_009005 [Hyaloscypha variabilis]